jgi:hypothetical protein
MSYYTETGPREDLARIDVNPPEEYIGTTIMPVVPVMEKSGIMAYATVTADAAAATGRVAGVAPVATQISNSEKTYTCAEAVKRAGITPDEVKQMGGLPYADPRGASWAKRQVMAYREGLIAANVLTTASVSFDPAKFRTQGQTALNSIRKYRGQTALVGGTFTLKALVQGLLSDSVTGPLFARLVTGSDSTAAAQGLGFEAFARGLALYVGVDRVLAGDDEIWSVSGSTAEKISFTRLPPSDDPLSHKWMPVYGKVFTFIPDGVQGWEVDSVADRVNINNLYTAKQWIDVEVLNAAANYVIGGVSA